MVIGLGYGLKRFRFFKEHTRIDLNRLIYYIILPILLFSITNRLNMHALFSWKLMLGFPVTLVIMVLIAIIIGAALPYERRSVFVQGAFRGNLAHIGIPVSLTVLGDHFAGEIALLVGMGAIANALLSIIILTIWSSKPHATLVVSNVKKVFYNPLIIAICVGFLFSLLHISVPSFMHETISLISRVGLPVILLLVGMSFSFKSIKDYVVWDSVAVFLKLIIMPSVAFGVMRLLGAEKEVLQVTVVLAAMPTAIVSHTFARQFGADEKFAGSIVNFATFAMLLTLPIIVYFIF